MYIFGNADITDGANVISTNNISTSFLYNYKVLDTKNFTVFVNLEKKSEIKLYRSCGRIAIVSEKMI